MTVNIRGTLTKPNYSLAPILKVRAKSLIKVIEASKVKKLDEKSYQSIREVNEVGELLVNILELLQDAEVDSDLDVFVEEIFEVAMSNDIYDLIIELRSIIVLMGKTPEINYRLVFYALINLLIRAYDYGTVLGINHINQEVVFDNEELNLLDREMLILVEAGKRNILDSELGFVEELNSYIQANTLESFNDFANKIALATTDQLFDMLFEAPNTLAEVVIDMIMRDVKDNQPIHENFYSCAQLNSYHADVVGYAPEPMNWAGKEVLMELVATSTLGGSIAHAINVDIPTTGIKLMFPGNTEGILGVTVNRNVRDGMDILTIDAETIQGINRFMWFDLNNVATFYSQTHYGIDSTTVGIVLYYLGAVDEERVDIPAQYRKGRPDFQELIRATMQTLLSAYKSMSNLAVQHN